MLKLPPFIDLRIIRDNLPATVHDGYESTMEYRRDSHGLLTFFEHWGMLFFVIVVLLASQLFFFLTRAQGTLWLVLCAGGIALQIVGTVLIGYAKLPLYQSGRFITFGVKSIPAHRAGHYRWGWRVFLIGVTLSLGLLLGKF